ncbi:MAG: serine hydrolase [Burkholderiales bacterium]|nr:serine hydrolase [Burkholderiales bacterium]
MNHPSTTRAWRSVTLSVFATALVFSAAIHAQDATNADAIIAKSIEATLAPHFKPGEPGATVIVTRDGKPIYRGAFGLADVEKKTPLKPDDVLRIGSLTKQFTAVATLMLVDQGTLSVSDPITKYLSDYPKTGDAVTIEHLLTHTSGIPSYTGLPEYGANMSKAVTVNEIIARFKDLPLQFKPGSKWEYSNSGYFLLGAIIERVSGMRYADFVAKNIFEPLGMNDSAYEGFERSGKKRVEGYADRSKVAPTLHMSQPFAAGSLLSSVDDLARWDAAISAGKLLKDTTWKRAFTPYTLTDGSKTVYGYGWGVRKLQGQDANDHSGGINGFVSYGVRAPESKVYAAMLFNRAGGGGASPAYLTEKIAAIAMGKPYKDLKAVTLDDAALDKHIGIYKLDERTNRTVTREGNQLFIQRTGGGKGPISAASATEFFQPNSFTTFTFETDTSGETTHLVVNQSSGTDRSPRTSKTPPAAKKGIPLAAGVFDQYVGVYTIAPGITMTVSRDGEKFFTRVTGQGLVEILAEAEDKFFATEVDAQIRFVKDAEGKVNQLIILQRGRETPAKRNP